MAVRPLLVLGLLAGLALGGLHQIIPWHLHRPIVPARDPGADECNSSETFCGPSPNASWDQLFAAPPASAAAVTKQTADSVGRELTPVSTDLSGKALSETLPSEPQCISPAPCAVREGSASLLPPVATAAAATTSTGTASDEPIRVSSRRINTDGMWLLVALLLLRLLAM
jgi:hypothetical protein